ncbi:MAG: NAD(P)-dependent oxidoreductase [bacterium]|nr:NAD(P)-dependent oxidoreductase [bacterium]
MKILILGAKGMLGQALAKEFAGDDLLLWDKGEIDITDFQNSKFKIQNSRPDVIINCAAYTDVDGCEDNQELAYKLNGAAVANLADIANEVGATLVQYSTSYVFDGKVEDGYKENAIPAPLSVYGKSKLAGERGAASAKKHYILRLDRLFGRPGAGKKSFVDKMLELATGRVPSLTRPPATLSHLGEGRGEVGSVGKSENIKSHGVGLPEIKVIDEEEGCPTYAPDLAKVTRKILEEKLPYGIYHTANSGSCTWFGFAEAIFKIAAIGVELKPIGSKGLIRKAPRPKYAVLLNTKLPALRPWQPALAEYLSRES